MVKVNSQFQAKLCCYLTMCMVLLVPVANASTKAISCFYSDAVQVNGTSHSQTQKHSHLQQHEQDGHSEHSSTLKPASRTVATTSDKTSDCHDHSRSGHLEQCEVTCATCVAVMVGDVQGESLQGYAESWKTVHSDASSTRYFTFLYRPPR